MVELKISPLRERKSDIPFLLNHFLSDFCKEHNKKIISVSKELLDFFENYSWQGNARELKNLVERMVIFSSDEVLSLKDLPPEMMENYSYKMKDNSNNKKELPFLDLSLLEKEAILTALKETGDNKTQAAKLLGIGLRTLHRKLNEYNIYERSE